MRRKMHKHSSFATKHGFNGLKTVIEIQMQTNESTNIIGIVKHLPGNRKNEHRRNTSMQHEHDNNLADAQLTQIVHIYNNASPYETLN